MERKPSFMRASTSVPSTNARHSVELEPNCPAFMTYVFCKMADGWPALVRSLASAPSLLSTLLSPPQVYEIWDADKPCPPAAAAATTTSSPFTPSTPSSVPLTTAHGTAQSPAAWSHLTEIVVVNFTSAGLLIEMTNFPD
ncbi:hypothetical protein TcWFU_001531 [Taenia crassiceps]|uniref:Uncharacterized protein n=1 Tax=Taenia crassiceps TaxID=6207 RepID=A0ABR4QFK0_9CEST